MAYAKLQQRVLDYLKSGRRLFADCWIEDRAYRAQVKRLVELRKIRYSVATQGYVLCGPSACISSAEANAMVDRVDVQSVAFDVDGNAEITFQDGSAIVQEIADDGVDLVLYESPQWPNT